MPNKYNTKQVENLTSTLKEKVGGRGDGAILYEKVGGIINSYFIYYLNGVKKSKKIGNLKIGKISGLTLSEIRDQAIEYSRIKKEFPDLKAYLERQIQVEVQESELKASTGSFKDLLDSYTKSLSNEDTKQTVKNMFKKDVFGAFPELKEIKASDVSVDHIVKILKKVFDRGVTTGGNRLRSYLLSAFNKAVLAANDPLKQDKKFNIKINPVLSIPKQKQFERVSDRCLSHDEVKHLWNNIHDIDFISNNTAFLIQFLIAIGGQRPQQLVRAGWDKYDYRLRTVLITDTKGCGDSRDYLTPLTQRAFDILEKLDTDKKDYPFTNDGKIPVRMETIHKWVERYCKQFEIEKFTPKDIRRTCKNLMIDAGVNREARNLIQNHGLTGVDYKHYDKRDHLPEKLEGMRKFDQLLDRIITGKLAKVVHI
ncbi:MAG: tyrosine-type recombinase/integrase [gamma proteobacterium symbiont of Taylorina sp.]|nr:tyrosine-type recombinase/integrase [gamma proteobacterium symbiont of Taylorina sp.]